MTISSTPELTWLAATTLFTALMWLPYVLERLASRGVVTAIADTKAETLTTTHEWAQRAIRAHANAVENLVLFAATVLIANALSVSTPLTQSAAMIYFIARLVHYFVYLLGIPVVRTLAFAAAWAAQLLILLTVFSVIS